MCKMLKYVFLLMVCLARTSAIAGPHEYHFRFLPGNGISLDSISRIISIDKIDDGFIWAYASPKEMTRFKQTGISYSLCNDGFASKASYSMAQSVEMMQGWNCYPTYSVYDTMMHNYADAHPDICKLEVIATLKSGHQILALKISNDINNDSTPKPEALCTSNMHGNECVCMVTALHLCDYLLNTTNCPSVKRLIDSTEIWIIPLYNPDGMYRGSDNSIDGATRSNAHSVDLNRNFPQINEENPHPDGNSWQEETIAMMEFYDKHHFSLSLNLHAGNECFNYPWDTWKARTADDAWWQLVGGNYRDTAQHYNSNYFADACGHSANGLTDGWDWYSVTGGQQDYANYYKHCREATIEICSSKISSSSTLPILWERNHKSIINYISESLNGVHGVVTDTDGKPISARITIEGHDKDNSWVETDPKAGDYHRYLKAGTYNITFSADKYLSQTVAVNVVDGKPTIKNIILNQEATSNLCTTKSIDVRLGTNQSTKEQIVINNNNQDAIPYFISFDSTEWFSVGKDSGTVPQQGTDTIDIFISSGNLSAGRYSAIIKIESETGIDSTTVNLEVESSPTEIMATSISIHTLPAKTKYEIGDTLDVRGGYISVKFSNDSTALLPIEPSMTSGFNSHMPGMQTLTIGYQLLQAYFDIYINSTNDDVPASIKTIAIIALPIKMDYELGDTLCLDGGLLKVTFSNDSSTIIPIDSATISGFESTTIGSKAITATLKEHQLKFYVNVNGKNTDIDEQQIASHQIFVTHRSIVVKNAKSASRIFDINGHCVASLPHGTHKIAISKPGIYIVTIGGTAQRIAIE